MWENNLLPGGFLGCESSFEQADTVLFGAPFDGTVTFRAGSRFAPAQMRLDSRGLETYSPYQQADLCDCRVHDLGDLDLPFGSTEKALSQIRETVQGIVAAGKRPFMVGGEHLVTLPAVESLFLKYNDLCVLHFDAHTDLRDEYLGEKLSHANVVRRCWDLLGDGRVFSLGIRSGTREEFDWAAQGHVSLWKFDLTRLDSALAAIGGRPCYVTVDLDVLDPAVLPGTGTPEPGGVTFKELLDALCMLRRLHIVGADVVELAPHYDASGASTAAACKTVRELLLAMQACPL